MIRPATVDDLDYMVDAAAEYLSVSAEGKFLTLDRDAFRHSLGLALEESNVIMLVDDRHRGHIVGVVTPSIWNPSETIARVGSIWVVPEHRGSSVAVSLMDAFEAAADDAVAILIDSNESLEPERTARLYERRGYTLEQKLYVKVRNGH